MTKLEQTLREKFGFSESSESSPKEIFQELGAFWQHWNLHKRKCDNTGESIISVFGDQCPYPVWQKDVWMEKADPPSCHPELSSGSKPIFEQLWALWQRSPIPHNFQSKNENCEYTDDWYQSKNCYMCHSGQNNEDCRYCYGCDGLNDVYWSVFSFDSELCADLIKCHNCFESAHLLNCRQVKSSAFLYDCRNCSDCLFCFNLRDKQYCFGNQQLSKTEYEAKKAEWDLSQAEVYNKARTHFEAMMKDMAWHRAQLNDLCEDSSGNFLSRCRQSENCFMISKHEDCVNVLFSGPEGKTILNSLGTVGAELSYMCVLPVYCYETRFCVATNNSKFCDYSAFLHNCEYCFGCCGLVNKKYHICNKPYSEAEYKILKEKIIEYMTQTGEWGEFFPSYFAPCPYEESLSGYYFPKSEMSFEDRPFRIDDQEAEFCKKLNLADNDRYYMQRIQDNLNYLNFTGSLRITKCANSGIEIQTNWPQGYDARILCEEEYLKLIK